MSERDNAPILFMSSHACWQDSDAGACLDALMTVAVFDVPARLVLHGDGVYQLLRGQDGGALQAKAVANMFGALGLYGIDTIGVDARALAERGLDMRDLLQSDDMDSPVAIDLLDEPAIVSLVQGARAVFSF